MPLSKDWTLADLRGIVRLQVDEIGQGKVQDTPVDSFIQLGLSSLSDMLADAAEFIYGTIAVVTEVSDAIDLTTLRIDSINKLTDITNGLVIPSGLDEFDNLSKVPQTLNNIFWVKYGETIKLYKGTAVASYGVLNLYYTRVPVKAVLETDFIDLPDKYMELLFDQTKAKIYEVLGRIPPEALTGRIQSKVAEIKKAAREERVAIEANK